MRVAFYLNSVSPHQLPLVREVAALLGQKEVLYVYVSDVSDGRLKCGWASTKENAGVRLIHVDSDEARDWLENADVVYSGLRDFALFARRQAKGLRTFYASERWFKPIPLGGFLLPGWLRVMSPFYLKMAIKFLKWQRSDPMSRCFAIGPNAAKDFRFMGISPNKIIPWGYYVDHNWNPAARHEPLGYKIERRILWVGRMVALKRVDTIISALKLLIEKKIQSSFTYKLTLVGDGPEREHLRKLSSGLPVNFLPFQPIEAIRGIMRTHDVFVFPSNGLEGWGAVVNEALSEGMVVLGSAAPGANLALLPRDRQFRVGDARHLARLLSSDWTADGLSEQWMPKGAAKTLLQIAGKQN